MNSDTTEIAPHSQPRGDKAPKHHNFSYLTWGIILIIILGAAVIRIPLLSVPFERDEGEYAYMGQLILQGIPPYAEAYNLKMPGIYAAYALLLAVFGQTHTGIHFGLLIINTATIVLLFFLGRKLLDPLTGLVAAASFAVLSNDMSYLRQNVSKESVAGFLDRDMYTSLKWLEANTETQDIVLADYEIGNYIPAITGNTVYISHSQQTIDFWGKWALVKRFFNKGSRHDFRKEFLKTTGIAYIIFSWKEKRIGDFDPESASYLEAVYRNKTVFILKVNL